MVELKTCNMIACNKKVSRNQNKYCDECSPIARKERQAAYDKDRWQRHKNGSFSSEQIKDVLELMAIGVTVEEVLELRKLRENLATRPAEKISKTMADARIMCKRSCIVHSRIEPAFNIIDTLKSSSEADAVMRYCKAKSYELKQKLAQERL